MDLNKRLYQILSKYFKDNVKLSFIADLSVIIVTKDDRFYLFDSLVNKTYHSIELTSDESLINTMIEKSEVKELCKKGVIDFKNGEWHTVARTQDRKLYVWGVDVHGAIGNGSEKGITFEPKLNKFLNDFDIIDMSCGPFHTLVLTSNGDVFAWGWNKFGQIGHGSESEFQSIPFKINNMLPERFKAICCGKKHSLVLTEDGRVYGCGANMYGQLGDGNATGFNIFVLIEMNGIKIEKIGCGSSHSLLLSNEGDIYALGNALGKHYKKSDSNTPESLKVIHSEKFCEIATHYRQRFFAALSMNGVFYVWDQIDSEEKIKIELKETNFKSFNDIFIHYIRITYQPVEEMIVEFEYNLVVNENFDNLYVDLAKLGEGGYGEVFKVDSKYKSVDKFDAVKKMEFKTQDEKEILKELEMFVTLSKLIHKNIIRYNNFWTEKNEINKSLTLFVEMEVCDQTLDKFIQSLHDLELKESEVSSQLKYYTSSVAFTEILEGVNFLHKQIPPIIHRDLCPDNILVKVDKNDKVVVRIADFGLATLHKYAHQSHEPELGHWEYIAPEALRDEGNYDTKADIFSLGMILNDLFRINANEKVSANSSSLEFKYQLIRSLFIGMTTENVDIRPKCQEILDDKNSWTLNAVEFVNFDEFDEFEMVHISQFSNQPILHRYLLYNILDELEDGVNLTKIPKNPVMKSLEKRKQSFKDGDWDQIFHVSVDELAEAGFFKPSYDDLENQMLEAPDLARCFHCSIGIYEWYTEDAPLTAHAKHGPNCYNLKLINCNKVINKKENIIMINTLDELIDFLQTVIPDDGKLESSGVNFTQPSTSSVEQDLSISLSETNEPPIIKVLRDAGIKIVFLESEDSEKEISVDEKEAPKPNQVRSNNEEAK